MCKLVEDYVAEKLRQANIQTTTNFLKNGVSVDIVAKSIPSLSRDFILELRKSYYKSRVSSCILTRLFHSNIGTGYISTITGLCFANGRNLSIISSVLIFM